jgi:hypothetical protein
MIEMLCGVMATYALIKYLNLNLNLIPFSRTHVYRYRSLSEITFSNNQMVNT